MMRIVKLILVFGLLFDSDAGFTQTLKPTNNKGGYIIEYFENNHLKKVDSIVIYGKVLSLSNHKNIGIAEVIFGCITKKITKNGDYKFRSIPNDVKTNYLTAKGLGHKAVETAFFSLKPGDSIKIDFYLSEDNRPIINCMER